MEAELSSSSGGGENILLVVIISIVIVNHLVIYKAFFHARGLSAQWRRAKHLTVIGMAYGDIFVALFPLTARLHSLSTEQDLDQDELPCWERILSQTYLFYFMPFVKSVGLLVLVAESFYFWRQQITSGSSSPTRGLCGCYSALISCLPWVLGLVVVLPLVLYGFDFNQCFVQYSLTRIQSFYVITVFLPGMLALLVTFLYYKCSRNRIPDLERSCDTTSTHATYVDKQPLPNKQPNKCSEFKSKWSNDNEYKSSSTGSTTKNSTLNITFCAPNCTSDNLHISNYAKDDRMLLLDNETETHVLPPEEQDTYSVISMEKSTLLADAVVFCVTSMPAAIVSLVLLFNEPTLPWPISGQVARNLETLYRLHVLRSLISPLVWLNTYN